MITMEDLKYPIGKYNRKDNYSQEELNELIDQIASLPDQLQREVQNLSKEQLDTPYREGGWTVRQVIHHLPDSHLNAYIRMKWAMTEDTPVIKAYDEKAWAETPETKLEPKISLDLLKALHTRWVALMRGFSASDLKKEFTHPDTNKNVSLDKMIAMYAW
ncbi:MAG: putative metal-dependent hydrolase, partial [Cyclobacteriaceae bacterium]